MAMIFQRDINETLKEWKIWFTRFFASLPEEEFNALYEKFKLNNKKALASNRPKRMQVQKPKI